MFEEHEALFALSEPDESALYDPDDVAVTGTSGKAAKGYFDSTSFAPMPDETGDEELYSDSDDDADMAWCVHLEPSILFAHIALEGSSARFALST